MKKLKELGTPPKGTGHPPQLTNERVVGMEAYKRGLLLWLEAEVRKDIIKGATKMSDVYIGKMNAYKYFIDHIKGNLRKKKSSIYKSR